MSYERYALIVDSDRAELGPAAMRLLDLGIDVVYANDVDEAELLARQESARLGAVLLPFHLLPSRVDELLARVCSQLEAGASALVPVGPAPDPELVASLAARGVEWRLTEPYDERALRFVMTAAMATGHAGERRKSLRIPLDVETVVWMGRYRKEVRVHDISSGGAYFAARHPFLEGSQLTIDIPLPNGAVVGKATVVNAKTEDVPARADVPDGMGVSFTRLMAGSEERLRAFLEEWLARFRLEPGS